MELETVVDILTESCTCLPEAKSHGVILWLKLCIANIPMHTPYFMEIQQKDNETLTAYVHCFKIAAK